MKETAVEWLEEQIKTSKFFYKLMEDIQSRSTVAQSNIFEQAKEIEKEQIKDSFLKGYVDDLHQPLPDDYYDYNAEQYYNETFNKEI
jgi:predicted Mrr-cat superfamily restriction endonuclease